MRKTAPESLKCLLSGPLKKMFANVCLKGLARNAAPEIPGATLAPSHSKAWVSRVSLDSVSYSSFF